MGLWEFIFIFAIVAIFFSFRGRMNYMSKLKEEEREELIRRQRKEQKGAPPKRKEKVVHAEVISIEDSDR